MRQSFQITAIVLCILFIISSSTISARVLQNKEGQEEPKLKENSDGDSLMELEGTDDFMNLMGMEACVDGDEDCLKRRVTAEAHLDYIYTQHHKP